MSDYTINPQIWFAKRELSFIPAHFIQSKVPLYGNSLDWIVNQTSGRYAILHNLQTQEDSFLITMANYGYPAFENPQEAIMYELKWG